MSSSLKRKRRTTYTEEDLKQAIEDIKSGATLNVTSRKYKIPRTTLHARVTNRISSSRLGPKPALSDKDEANLAAWVEHMCSIGCSVSRNQIGDSVLLSLKTSNKTNPFVNKRPGKSWYDGFVRRHNLSEKVRETRRQLFKGIGVNGTTKWFKNLNDRLGKGNLHGLSRLRTYSIGEVSLPMHLKSSPWCVKEGPTVLITANAAGHVLPPMIIFDSSDDSKCDIKLPRGWSVEANDKADLSAELLYNYMTNHFYTWLTKNGIQLPIVLFLYQELATYLTEALCDFCDKHKILLAVLPPSPHQATTPIEITLFPTIRREYMRNLKIFVKKKRVFSIGKDDFIGRLEEALNCTDTENSLEKGFYKCGLYPLSAERHIGACIRLEPDEDVEESAIVDESSSVLKCIESNLDPTTIESFRSVVDYPMWIGKVEDTNLFYLWRNIMKSVAFGRNDESNKESCDLQLSNPNINENQENELPSDNMSDPKSCVQDKHKPLNFIDNNLSSNSFQHLNNKSLDENISIIVVHPNAYIEENDSDEDWQILNKMTQE